MGRLAPKAGGQSGLRDARHASSRAPNSGWAKACQDDTVGLLDLLWGYFGGELFTVWIKVWLAAAEDEDLYTRLAPIERRLNKALAAIVASARPARVAEDVWTRRVTAALHALRQELIAMIDRP